MPVQVITDATKHKRLTRLTMQKAKTVFFTDENIFCISPPVNRQTIMSGQEAENVMLIHDASWSNEPSSRRTSWCLQECALEAREGFLHARKGEGECNVLRE